MNSQSNQAANARYAIEAASLSKTFGTGAAAFHAMGPIDISIRPGEFVSILGPSGCGKSTAMLMLAGLLPPTEGDITANGELLTEPLTDIGVVFQDHLLLEFKTAIGNVLLQQQIRGLDRGAQESRAKALFEALEITGAEDKYPSQLSGGMRQRVSIARALVHQPSFLYMDEPFGALDAISRTQIRHDLERLWLEHKMTVLFITHSIEEAIGLSDRVLIMSKSPGVFVDEIAIDLPRPRPTLLGHQPEFNQYADRIYQTFERIGVHHFSQETADESPATIA